MRRGFLLILALFTGVFISNAISHGNGLWAFSASAFAHGESPTCWLIPCEGCIPDEHEDTNAHFVEELRQTERWLILDMVNGYIIPGMMSMTEEFTVTAMQQINVIGGYFDGWMENETHRALQEMQAKSHNEMFPSEGMCVLATNVRNLAKTDRFTKTNQLILSNRAMMRHLGTINDNSDDGVSTDLGEQFQGVGISDTTEYRSGRLKQFQDTYCQPKDNAEYFEYFCGPLTLTGTPEEQQEQLNRLDRDFNYINFFAEQDTLYIDFVETLKDPTNTEEKLPDRYKKDLEDVIALQKNLYGHTVAIRPEQQAFKVPSTYLGDPNLHTNIIKPYLDYRSLVAKRNVVENSFNAIAAMKAKGAKAVGGNVRGYMEVLLKELGMTDETIDEMMKDDPSYWAQMEILTKKIYQNPQFYINLYESPENVKRKKVALQAVGLMQDWDMFESKMRTEMLASILVELSLKREHDAVEGALE